MTKVQRFFLIFINSLEIRHLPLKVCINQNLMKQNDQLVMNEIISINNLSNESRKRKDIIKKMETRIFIVVTLSLVLWDCSALYSQTPTIEFPMGNLTEVALNRQLIFSANRNNIALNSIFQDRSTHIRFFDLNGSRICSGSDLIFADGWQAVWPQEDGLILVEYQDFQGFSQIRPDCEAAQNLVYLPKNAQQPIGINYNSKTYLTWAVPTDNNSIIFEYNVQTTEQRNFTTRNHEKWQWRGYSPDYEFLYGRTSFNNSENVTRQKIVVHKLGNSNQTIDHDIITDIRPTLILRNGGGFIGWRVDNHGGQNITNFYRVNSTGGELFLFTRDSRERGTLLCTKNDYLVIVKDDNGTAPIHSWIQVYDTKEGTLLQNFTYGLIPIPPIGVASACNDEHLAIYGIDNHVRIFTITDPSPSPKPDDGGIVTWIIILIVTIVVLVVVAGVVWKVMKGKAMKDQYEKFKQQETV